MISMKYNKWCYRKPIVDKKSLSNDIFTKTRILDIPELYKAVILQNEFLRCRGIEFVSFSNIKINRNFKFNNGLELRPCFYSDDDKFEDGQIFESSMLMNRRSKFIYDGWLPISNYTRNSVADYVEMIDQSLSIFSISGYIYFTWEPKYFYRHIKNGFIDSEYTNDVNFIPHFSSELSKLNQKDKIAIYRSINWINKAISNDEPMVSFLFYMISLEYFADYIEKPKKYKSIFDNLKSNEKNESTINISEEIFNDLQTSDDPFRIISNYYFKYVVGIKKNIENQLRFIFKGNEEFIKIFNKKIQKKTLYDIRSDIAHGSINPFNQEKINQIRKRLPELKHLSISYLKEILTQCKINYYFKVNKFCVSADFDNAISSDESKDTKPVHMAIHYFNRI